MKQHSPFGGSQVGRYMACPGSVQLAEKAPPRPSSAYAEEGTFAHALAEACLNGGKTDARPYVGQLFAFEDHGETKQRHVTEEAAQAVNVYLDTVWAEYNADNGEIEVEQRFAVAVPAVEEGEVFGTNDALVYSHDTSKLTIFDYKHGQGVIVDVEGNTQFKFYALGAVQAHPEWSIKEIEFVVVQPRAANAGETQGVHRWSLPLYELIDFPEELNQAIALAKSEEPPFNSGGHCRWCPAAAICTVREQEFLDAARSDFASVTELAEEIPSANWPEDVEHMARLVEAYEKLGGWIAQLRERIDDILLSGGEVPGWKVVEKVARRKWVAEGPEVAAHLALAYDVPEELVIPPTLVTITEAKRLLKSFAAKEQYAEAERDLTLRFTIKEPSGLTTAPTSDKRAAIKPVAAEFGSVMLGD